MGLDLSSLRDEVTGLGQFDADKAWELAVQLMLARPELPPTEAVKQAVEARRQLAREQATRTSP